MTDDPPIIVRFRNDLRVADNPVLAAAAVTGRPVVPLYILDDAEPLGGAARWWLHGSVTALAETLKDLGTPLVLRRGDPEKIIPALATEIGARSVFWSRRYEPGDAARDARLAEALGNNGVSVRAARGNLLHEPGRLLTKSGAPYHVFTPFWRALRVLDPGPIRDTPSSLRPPATAIASDRLADWRLLPVKPDWSAGFSARWRPGEDEARRKLDAFLAGPVEHYAVGRNLPGDPGTSRLSPHLHWGEISPRQIWHAAQAFRHAAAVHDESGVDTFLSELGWREFSHQLLHHHPDLAVTPMRPEFAEFPWRADPEALAAWRQGRTGYPIVDAGMRELWTTGWMHNRVRMIVASFLTKHLLQPWQEGARWFMDTLVDADLAANSTNWQWVAGCGADAAPYFRIFNPVLQGQKFDAEGRYVREWVPELKARPTAVIHQPLAEDERRGGYPRPVIDHAAARARALDAFAGLRRPPR